MFYKEALRLVLVHLPWLYLASIVLACQSQQERTWLESVSKWAADAEGRAMVALQREPWLVYIGDGSLSFVKH